MPRICLAHKGTSRRVPRRCLAHLGTSREVPKGCLAHLGTSRQVPRRWHEKIVCWFRTQAPLVRWFEGTCPGSTDAFQREPLLP